jgi:RsiW-degrading membrane proteinase PrsW (M82 family)
MVEEKRDLSRVSMVFAALLVISGSVFAIPGIFQAELTALGLLAAWVWAPVIEEAFKPAGVYLILIKWPGTLKNRAVTALLTALAGITFGLVESTIYMAIYFPEHTQSDLVFRYTIPVMIHTLASFIFGLGLNQQLLVSWKRGGPFLISNWGFFLAAVVIHSVYNITVTVLDI